MSAGSGRAAMQVRRAEAVAGLAGLGCMALELTAVRLLAPHFGDSAYVWTNVIGVILLALALGAWFGGRLAERHGGRPLGALLIGAALLTAAAPLVAGPLGGYLLPQELPLDHAMPAMVSGSLAATIVLFAPPVFLLGAVSPGLITAAVRGGAPIGRAAGGIAAAGTAGSLVGTFAATHFLVPMLGCRLTLWSCAATLGLAAALAGAGRRGGLALLLLLPLPLLLQGPLRPAPSGTELLAERESRYQFLQVLRRTSGAGAGRIELKINEGLDSFHSVAVPGSAFSGGSYYDYHVVAPMLCGDGTAPEPLGVLSIGDGAGTFRRLYAALFPTATVDAVELDPAAVELGEAWFPGPKAAGLIVTELDGRIFVAHAGRQWHVVHVDAYAHQVYIPAQLASREFFTAVLERLLPGGIVTCNVGGLHRDDPVVAAIARTMAAVFGEAAGFQVPHSRNVLLVGRRARPIDPARLAGPSGAERLTLADQAVWQQVLEQTRQLRHWWRVAAQEAAHVLGDDRPELDHLLHRSYVAARQTAPPLVMAGVEDVAAIEGEAHAALAAGDAEAVLAVLHRSRGESAYLRYVAGTARWLQRDLLAAAAEYRAALALGPALEVQDALQRQLAVLEQELEPQRAAAATAIRNRWLAVAASVALVIASALLLRLAAVDRIDGRRT